MTDPVIASTAKPKEIAEPPPAPVAPMAVAPPPIIDTPAPAVPLAPRPPAAAGPAPEHNPTSAQDFYAWLTDNNTDNANQVENVLFKKNS